MTAADAYQDAVVALLEALPRLEDKPEDVARDAWLVMRAWGVLKDTYARQFQTDIARGRVISPRVDSGEALKSAVAPSHAEGCDVRMDIAEAIDRVLTPAQAKCARACLLEGMSQTDYAAQVGLGESAVSRLLSRAKERLRVALATYVEE